MLDLIAGRRRRAAPAVQRRDGEDGARTAGHALPGRRRRTRRPTSRSCARARSASRSPTCGPDRGRSASSRPRGASCATSTAWPAPCTCSSPPAPTATKDRQHAPTATLPLARPSADTRVAGPAAVRRFAAIYRPGFRYVKAGVMLVDLQPQQPAGHHARSVRRTRTDAAADGPARPDARIDALNQRFGRDSVTVASAAAQAGRQLACVPAGAAIAALHHAARRGDHRARVSAGCGASATLAVNSDALVTGCWAGSRRPRRWRVTNCTNWHPAGRARFLRWRKSVRTSRMRFR